MTQKLMNFKIELVRSIENKDSTIQSILVVDILALNAISAIYQAAQQYQQGWHPQSLIFKD